MGEAEGEGEGEGEGTVPDAAAVGLSGDKGAPGVVVGVPGKQAAAISPVNVARTSAATAKLNALKYLAITMGYSG